MIRTFFLIFPYRENRSCLFELLWMFGRIRSRLNSLIRYHFQSFVGNFRRWSDAHEPSQKWYLMSKSLWYEFYADVQSSWKKHFWSTISWTFNVKRSEHFCEVDTSLHYPSFEVHEAVNDNANFYHFSRNDSQFRFFLIFPYRGSIMLFQLLWKFGRICWERISH